MPANPKLQKIIKLTQTQYDTLSQGGTVGDYTGLDDRYLYLIQDDTEYQPLNSKLTSISNLSNSSTGLIKLTNGTASLDTTNYLSLTGGNLTGTLSFNESINQINFRPTNADYTTNVAYETNGNEALVFKTKNTVTSFIFANGVTSSTSAAEWQSIVPGLQIKNNAVSINKLIANGVSPSYQLDVNGTANATTLYENGTTLSSKYLGISATAVNSTKLNGQEASYYLNYNNLTNKPTIPTVNNATLTIQNNGVTVNTFTANASSDVTANIQTPTIRRFI